MNELNTKAQDVQKQPLIWCGMCGQRSWFSPWAFRGQSHDWLQTHGRLFFLQRNEFFPPHSFIQCFEWQLTGSSCPCFVLRRGGVRSKHPLIPDWERTKERSVPSLTTMATAYSVSDSWTHSLTHTLEGTMNVDCDQSMSDSCRNCVVFCSECVCVRQQ